MAELEREGRRFAVATVVRTIGSTPQVVGAKLLVEYLHSEGYIGFEIPKWLSLGLIVVIFGIALMYALLQEKNKGKSH